MADLARHVVCPSCGAINRVPATRSALDANCGTCHNKLFTGQPVKVDGKGFERHTVRNDIPVVVDFWAPWCGPCQAMAPQYAQAAAELEPKVRLAKLNTEVAQRVAGEFGIRSIPTLMVFKSGREVARQAGAMGKADIIRWVQAHA